MFTALIHLPRRVLAFAPPLGLLKEVLEVPLGLASRLIWADLDVLLAGLKKRVILMVGRVLITSI